jgi:hypothetical protein
VKDGEKEKLSAPKVAGFDMGVRTSVWISDQRELTDEEQEQVVRARVNA